MIFKENKNGHCGHGLMNDSGWYLISSRIEESTLIIINQPVSTLWTLNAQGILQGNFLHRVSL